MKETNKNITKSTLFSFLKGTLTLEEVNMVKDWLNVSEANRKQFSDLKKVWEHTATIDDFHSINASYDWQKLKTKIKFAIEDKPNSNVHSLSGIQWFVRIAAIFILFTGLAYAFFNYTEVFNPGRTDIIVSTTHEKKSEIILADGTVVNLNKNSQISYPEKFDGNIRKVKLKGEGYFDVADNKEKPFVIETGNNAIIKVLGTVFNIKNEKVNNSVQVHVLNGKVVFYESGKEEDMITLTKKQQAELTKDGITKSETFNINFLSWKTGILVFENQEIEKVVQELSIFYQKKILLENKENKTYEITSTFDNEELKDVLEEIKLILNAEYKYENDTVIFYL